MAISTVRRAGNQTLAQQRVVWKRLEEFSFDLDDAAKPFSVRLAAEQGWSKKFTEQVVNEYRRFLFLTAAAGHTVCPSEEVDAAWHQHLLYTRSYWDDLCGETLGYPLHHDPTEGGPAEGRKHWAMYRQTLESYRRIFGEDPPRDVWPPPFERFDPHSQQRTVNVRDYWIVAKPGWWPRTLRRRASLAVCLLPVPAVGLGPLDLKGPEFLVLFFGLYLILFIGAIIYCRVQRDVSVTEDRELSPEEIACLKFGRPAAVNAAVASMLHLNQLVSITHKGFLGQTNGSKVTFGQGPTPPLQEHRLARAIYHAVESEKKTLIQIQGAVDSETREIDEQLRQTGYLLDESQIMPARLVAGLAMFALLALGVTKIAIGIQRDRPVVFLILGCLLVLITFIGTFASIRRSLTGDRMLKSLESHHVDLKSNSNPSVLSGNNVALCAALFGSSALQGPVFDDLKSAWKATSTGGSVSSVSGCGGGCGGGGGGCGGGGGGCGGCGG